MDARIHIARQLRKTCLLHGEFVLRSGVKSDVYFDKYRILSNPELRSGVAFLMADYVPTSTHHLLASGGLCTDVLMTGITTIPMHEHHQMVVVRPERKDHGTQNRVEGLVEGHGRAVVIIEDVVTSGGSVVETADALIEVGLIPTHVVALLDRQQGGAEMISHSLPGASYHRVFTLSEILAA